MDNRLGRRRRAGRRSAAALTAALLTVPAPDAPAQTAGWRQPALPAPARGGYPAAAEELLPVSPEDITDFNARLLRVRQAAASRRPFPDAPASEAGLVTLEPGGRPPVARLAPGVASVVTFADATGQPWPVAGYVLGDAGAFEVFHPGGADGEQAPSHLTIAPLAEAGWTNLVVELAGQPIPVILSLAVEPSSPHYRLDVQVLALGPNALPGRAPEPSAPKAGSADLLGFLSGADIPPEAVEAGIDNVGGVRVWLLPAPDGGRGRMVVRTPHALLGPEWSEVMNGAAGVRVYRMREAASLLFSVNGGAVIARIRQQ